MLLALRPMLRQHFLQEGAANEASVKKAFAQQYIADRFMQVFAQKFRDGDSEADLGTIHALMRQVRLKGRLRSALPSSAHIFWSPGMLAIHSTNS